MTVVPSSTPWEITGGLLGLASATAMHRAARDARAPATAGVGTPRGTDIEGVRPPRGGDRGSAMMVAVGDSVTGPTTAAPTPGTGPAAIPARCPVAGPEVYPDWETAYRDTVSAVFRLMLGKVGNRPDAEDLTAAVFLTAWPALPVPASVRQVRANLLATARTVLRGYWQRRVGRQITTLDEDQTLESAPAGMVASPLMAERARAILAQLPEPSRRILQLRFVDSCTLRQAATAMGVDVRAVTALQHRALHEAAQLLAGATP